MWFFVSESNDTIQKKFDNLIKKQNPLFWFHDVVKLTFLPMFITHYTGVEAVKDIDKILTFENANRQFKEYVKTQPGKTLDESQFKIDSYIQHKDGNNVFESLGNTNLKRYSASVIQNNDNNLFTTFETLWFPHERTAKPMNEIESGESVLLDKNENKKSVEDAVLNGDRPNIKNFKALNIVNETESDSEMEDEQVIVNKVEKNEEEDYGISGTVADIFHKPTKLSDFLKIYENHKLMRSDWVNKCNESTDESEIEMYKEKILDYEEWLIHLFNVYHVSNKREDYLEEANFFHQYFFENLNDLGENTLQLPSQTVSGLTFSSQLLLDFLYNVENITLVNSNFDVFLLVHHAVMSAADSYDKEVQNNVLLTGPQAGGKSFMFEIQKFFTVGGIYYERADITEGVLTSGSSLTDRVFVQNEASMKLFMSGGKREGENLVNLMKTIMTEKMLSKERLQEYKNTIVRREMGFTYVGATNKHASYIEGPTKSRLCTIQCPSVSRSNREVKSLHTLFKKKKDTLEFKNFCANHQKLHNLVYFVNKFIQCKIFKDDVDFVVFDYICDKFNNELKVYNLQNLFTTRIQTQMRRVCKTLVILRALYFALGEDFYTLKDLKKVKPFLYSTTDVTLMSISMYVNKFYDTFKNTFLLHVLKKHELVVEHKVTDENGNETVENKLNPDLSKFKSDGNYFVVENVVDTSSYNSDKQGLNKFVLESIKTFNGRTYADTDVKDAVKSLLKEDYKGSKILKQNDHFSMWYINKTYLDDLLKNGDFIISVFNKVGKICGGGVIMSEKFPILMFTNILKPYSPSFMNIEIPKEGINVVSDVMGHTHFENLDSMGYFSYKSKVVNAVAPFDFPTMEHNIVDFKDRYKLKSLRSKRGLSYKNPRAPKRRKLQKIVI